MSGLPSELLARTEALLTAECVAPAFRVADPSPKKKSPHYVPDVRFDLERVARVVYVAENLVHIKGELRGRPIMLEPFQVQHIIAPLFGWVVPHDGPREWRRVRRYGLIETGRKSGKTTIGAVIAVTLLTADDEPAPEVYTGATVEKQSRKLYDPARDMMLAAPRLKSHVRSLTDKIIVPKNGGEFVWTTERRAEGDHGGNVHGFLGDELHVHKSPALLETMETGTGSRVQPMVVIFTTADEGAVGTVYDERHREIEAMAVGNVGWEPSIFGAIWCLSETDDVFDEANWPKANPNLGVSKTWEYMRQQAEKAKRTPSYLPTFERLDLGLRRKSDVTWFPMDLYAGCDHRASISDLAGKDVAGAVDLSAVDDFTALVWWAPGEVRSPAFGDDKARWRTGGTVIARMWCTEAGIGRRPRMVRQLEQWAADGWLTITPGDAIDYTAVRAQLLDDASEFGHVLGVGFDPWNARQFAQELKDDHGLPMIEVPQTMKTLAAGSHRLEQLVLQRSLRTDGNPVLRWMMGNAVARRDTDNRVRPDKAKSGQKIDAVSALVSAIAVELEGEALPDFAAQFV